MSRARAASPDKNKERHSTQPLAILIIMAVLALMGACYLLTGLDPFDLFSVQVSAPPAEMSNRPRRTPTPVVTQAAPSGLGPTPPVPAAWWQVYFSAPNTINDPANPTGSIEEKLIGFIDQAQTSIHIAAFEFDLTPVANALILAHQRGVDVRWVTDDENGLGADEKPNRGQFNLLQKAGIEIRTDQRHGLMHNKFIIFDGQAVWTGSTNLTINDQFKNNNNVIVIQSKALADIYEAQWNDLWNSEFGSSAPSHVEQQRAIIDGTPIQILFSPEDKAMSYLVPLVQSAEHQIRFLAFSFTEDALTQAMLDRAAAGVDVSGIFETRGSETRYSALPPLFCAGLPVRQEGNRRGILHHKVIVIDGSILVTGSLNFSDNANNDNNENTLIIQNAAIAQQYLQEFDRRWAEANPPNLADMKCK